MDYETFGEHQWAESGIFWFLKSLPEHVFNHENLEFATPKETVKKYRPVAEIDVFELSTISWADMERDVSAWLGNKMQHICFEEIKHMEPLVKSLNNPDLLKIWRMLQTSDHSYYCCTKWLGDGDVHNYFNSFNSKLLLDLYRSALEIAENSDRITDAKKRLIIEKRVQKNIDFQLLTRVQQKKILSIESNLFFFKHSVDEIIDIAKTTREIKEYDFTLKNRNSLTIEIYRKIPINIGYLLSTLSHLNVVNMEIFTLFDGVKYFRIDFIKNVEGNELVEIQDIIDSSFDMDKEVVLNSVEIHKNEINLDCEHSLTHAELTVHTKNQKGLLSYIMDCFENLNINIVTAKIHSSKYKARDSFLIEKQNNICDNVDKIFKLLTKGK